MSTHSDSGRQDVRVGNQVVLQARPPALDSISVHVLGGMSWIPRSWSGPGAELEATAGLNAMARAASRYREDPNWYCTARIGFRVRLPRATKRHFVIVQGRLTPPVALRSLVVGELGRGNESARHLADVLCGVERIGVRPASKPRPLLPAMRLTESAQQHLLPIGGVRLEQGTRSAVFRGPNAERDAWQIGLEWDETPFPLALPIMVTTRFRDGRRLSIPVEPRLWSARGDLRSTLATRCRAAYFASRSHRDALRYAADLLSDRPTTLPRRPTRPAHYTCECGRHLRQCYGFVLNQPVLVPPPHLELESKRRCDVMVWAYDRIDTITPVQDLSEPLIRQARRGDWLTSLLPQAADADYSLAEATRCWR